MCRQCTVCKKEMEKHLNLNNIIREGDLKGEGLTKFKVSQSPRYFNHLKF